MAWSSKEVRDLSGSSKRIRARVLFDEEAGISREHDARKGNVLQHGPRERCVSARASKRRCRRYGVSKETVSMFDSKEEDVETKPRSGLGSVRASKGAPLGSTPERVRKIWVSQEIQIERMRRGSCDSARVSKGIRGFSTKRAPSRKRRSRSMRRAISSKGIA